MASELRDTIKHSNVGYLKDDLRRIQRTSAPDDYALHEKALELLRSSILNVIQTIPLQRSPLDVPVTLLSAWLQKTSIWSLSWLDDLTAALKNLDQASEYADIYFRAMYKAQWFPYIGQIYTDVPLIAEINDVLEHTRDSKNRVKKIDKVLYDYFDVAEIKQIAARWREVDQPESIKRIMLQTLKAFHRKEYAMVVIPLCTLWEGMICDKTDNPSHRSSKAIKADFSELSRNNGDGEIVSAYVNEFIFYECREKDAIKEDVPGRHGIAHGWYNRYPTRKAALNAIAFTDYLTQLNPSEGGSQKIFYIRDE